MTKSIYAGSFTPFYLPPNRYASVEIWKGENQVTFTPVGNTSVGEEDEIVYSIETRCKLKKNIKGGTLTDDDFWQYGQDRKDANKKVIEGNSMFVLLNEIDTRSTTTISVVDWVDSPRMHALAILDEDKSVWDMYDLTNGEPSQSHDFLIPPGFKYYCAIIKDGSDVHLIDDTLHIAGMGLASSVTFNKTGVASKSFKESEFGNLSDLKTASKTNAIGAINELYDAIGDITSVLKKLNNEKA